MTTSRRRLRTLAVLAAATLVSSACAEVVTLEGPEIGRAERRPPEQSLVYDAGGNRIGVLRREFRDKVDLDDLPQHLVDAVLVAEDRRFWEHGGVDVRAITRAAIRNLESGEVTQGGSTITQQLVKNLYMPEAPRTFRTKAREALLARDLEREMTKERILEEYLNTVYFGSGAYGVQAAAYTYWRKDAPDLTLGESALLAALIRSPATLDPHKNPRGIRARRNAVLRALRRENMAGSAKVKAAIEEPVEVKPRPPAPRTSRPYWLDFVSRTLLRDPSFGDDEADRAARLYGGGLRIFTTLQPNAQDTAEAVVDRFFPAADDPEVAIVAIDPASGAIVASVGGRDYSARQFDLASQGRRQPGSTFKTFVLTAALTEGYRPDSTVSGNEGVLTSDDGVRFEVDNYDGRSYGTITLDTAIRNSVNAAFARLALDIGVDQAVAAAHAMGVDSPLGTHPAVALGGLTEGVSPLEMAAAYATLANGGLHIPPSPIDRIENADGDVVWRPRQTPRQAVDPSVAWTVTQMLRGVVEDGTGVHARLPEWEVAGKTGTTSSYVDAWFVGYTPTLATSVWMGYPEGNDRPLLGIGGDRAVTGGSWPARMWREFMVAALADQSPAGFVLSEDAGVEVEIDPETDLLAAPWCPGETRIMPRMLVPRETCPSPAPTPSPGPVSGPTPSTSPPGGAPSEPSSTPCPTAGPSPGPDRREPGCPGAGPTPTPTPTPTPSSTSTSEPQAVERPSEHPSSEPEPEGSPTSG